MENIKQLRYVFMGSPAMSAALLDYLLSEQFNVVAVVTNPPKKVGRKQILTKTPVHELAKKHAIPVFTPHNIREEYNFINELYIDVILTFAYGQIVPKVVLDAARLGAYNYHGSILPKYRGASPLHAALINGDKLTGVSFMRMVEKMDAGRVYGVKMFPLFPEDNIETVTNKTIHATKCLTREVLKDVLTGVNKGEEQDESKVTFTTLLKASDFVLDINDNLTKFLGKIRAFNPEPGAVYHINESSLKIYEAKFENAQIVAPTGALFVINKVGLFLQHAEGVIALNSVQKPGKTRVSGLSYANGEQRLPRYNLGIFDE